jgi:hypothetical protein
MHALSAIQFAAECSEVHFRAFARTIVRAADLMQQPCPGKAGFVLHTEAYFVYELRKVIANRDAYGLTPKAVLLLAGTLQRLERSGAVPVRDVEEYISSGKSTPATFEKAVKASLTASDLRSCALASCGAKEAHPLHFKRCASCRAEVYCSREHQLADWPAHKAACKAARAREAGEGAEQD